MTAFAIAMGVAAEVVKVPAIVGIFTAGMCFGGSGALPTFFSTMLFSWLRYKLKALCCSWWA